MLPFVLLGMSFVGAVVGSAMLVRRKHAAAGTREYEEERGASGDISLWKRWLNSSRAVVDYEFRLMLLACYLLVIGPFALVFRLGKGNSAGAGVELRGFRAAMRLESKRPGDRSR